MSSSGSHSWVSGGRGLVAHPVPSVGHVEKGMKWTGCDLGLGTSLPGVESQLFHLLVGDFGTYSSFLCLSLPFCVMRIIVTLNLRVL